MADVRGAVTKRDCVNRGLTISEGVRAPTDDPSLREGMEINFERSWPRGIESPRKSSGWAKSGAALRRTFKCVSFCVQFFWEGVCGRRNVSI